MGDINWLLSSLAQSSAAIIAILGGFIVSRIITMAIEKRRIELEANAATNQRDEIEEQVVRMTTQLGQLSEDVHRATADTHPKSEEVTRLDERLHNINDELAGCQQTLEQHKLATKSINESWNDYLFGSLKPKEMAIGLLIFAYFGLAGLVYPLVLMAQIQNQVRWWNSWLPVFAFVSALALVFYFIIRQIGGLAKFEGRA